MQTIIHQNLSPLYCWQNEGLRGKYDTNTSTGLKFNPNVDASHGQNSFHGRVAAAPPGVISKSLPGHRSDITNQVQAGRRQWWKQLWPLQINLDNILMLQCVHTSCLRITFTAFVWCMKKKLLCWWTGQQMFASGSDARWLTLPRWWVATLEPNGHSVLLNS